MALAAQDRGLILGVELTAQTSVTTPPVIVVIAPPKGGKSCLSTTLFDWPSEGDRPLVLAFDEDGPDSCATIGYAVPHIKIGKQPGDSIWKKTQNVLKNLEDVYTVKGKKPYSSIVVDCGSTQADLYWTGAVDVDAALQRYGLVKDRCEEVLERLRGLGVPIIYYAWLVEPWVEESGSRTKGTYKREEHKGGISTRGNFRATLAGKAKLVLYLERQKVAAKTQGADADGYRRVFHTQPYAQVDCGGRYKLPEPMPADLGLVLAYMYGMVPNPALADLELKK